MTEDDFSEVFEDVMAKVRRNLKILWPASGTTAPTESNLATCLSSVLSNRGYAVFSEVPFNNKGRNGRIDLMAIHPQLGEMILFEAKSDKPSDGQLFAEMRNDWERLAAFELTDLPQNNAWINGEDIRLKKRICVGFWSERKELMTQDPLVATQESAPSVYKEWIEDGVNIGVKFLYKSM